MIEPNPYQPPESHPDHVRRLDRRRPMATLLRIMAVVAGFAILAGPNRVDRNVPYTPGQVAFKVFGGLLLVGAFLPIGRGRSKLGSADQSPEDL